jgi:hypothetical protein
MTSRRASPFFIVPVLDSSKKLDGGGGGFEIVQPAKYLLPGVKPGSSRAKNIKTGEGFLVWNDFCACIDKQPIIIK